MALILRTTLLMTSSLLTSCTTPVANPPAIAGTRAEAECKVMYDQAFIAARGYSDAQTAKQLYWDCLKAKGQ
jgi:hypothetical protein